MLASELRSKTESELQDRIVELKKELFNSRFQKVAQQFENTARIRQVRREVARIKTIQGEKVREASVNAPKATVKTVRKGK